MQSKSPAISVLVPVCNTSRFLRKCLDSILNQTFKDLEVICINDGSTDNSLEILKEYAEQDHRVIIIDKPNSGYGDSMNVGLSSAHGEYIGIVESDDYIEPDMYETLLNETTSSPDLVKMNYKKYWEDGDRQEFVNCLGINEKKSDLDECRDLILRSNGMCIWTAIYCRQWLFESDIWFLPTPGASYQDTSFCFKTAVKARSIVLIPDAKHNYRQDNPNSSVKMCTVEKAAILHNEYIELMSFLQKYGLEMFDNYLCLFIYNGINWNYGRLPVDDRKEYLLRAASEVVCKLKDRNLPPCGNLIRWLKSTLLFSILASKSSALISMYIVLRRALGALKKVIVR